MAEQKKYGSPTSIAILFIILLALPPIAVAVGQPYAVTFMARVLIFGLAALSLNLILGFGGLTSLGHAVFLGLGAYAVALMMQAGIHNGFVHIAVLLALGIVSAFVIGSVALRTSGLAFLMVTLALAQLVYLVGTGLRRFGGDDGFSYRGRADFGGLLTLSDDRAIYYYILFWLMLATILMYRLLRSRFGMALRATMGNPQRAESLGLPVFRYRLVAFVLSGTFCTIAGGLLAYLTQFVSPAYMHWSRSAELLLMVLIGGMGTLLGPIIGAIALIMVEEGLAMVTTHWQAPLGILLVLVVLFARNGLSDFRLLLNLALEKFRPKRATSPSGQPHADAGGGKALP